MIFSALQLALQALSIVAMLSGNLLVANVLSALADVVACSQIITYMMEAYYAQSIEEQNEAIENAAWEITCLIVGKMLQLIGMNPGYMPKGLVQIEEEAASLATELISYVFSALNTWRS